MPGYEVVTQALQAESRKWDELVEALGAIRAAVDDQTLEMTAFFVGDVNTMPHHAAYQKFQTFMVTVLSGGVTEFGQISDVLRKAGQRYEEAEDLIELDLNEIYSV